MNQVLVTGGCGYIGSHTIVDLIENGFDVLSVDSLINSTELPLKGIEKITGKRVKNYKIDLCDLEKVEQIFIENKRIIGVIHFAALKSVNESVDQPIEYFQNNLNSLLSVLKLSKKYGVNNFIFSSSCTVYGNVEKSPVTENTPLQKAESPYGMTKQMGEEIIEAYAKANLGSNNILLRYFNPGGAHESSLLGESPNNAKNLIPVITETGIGKRKSLTVFGNDYETRDGTCIRDFIHVMDLANAHTKALRFLIDKKNNQPVEIFNLGIGQGVTVLEAIKAFEKISGKKLNYSLGEKRVGDVMAIFSDFEKANKLLGWNPSRNIEDIMRTAWKWELSRSNSL